MGLSRRRFTQDFKLSAVQRLNECISVAESAGDGGQPQPAALTEFREGPGNSFPGHWQRRWSEGRIADFRAQTFLKACLQRIEAHGMLAGIEWAFAVTARSGK